MRRILVIGAALFALIGPAAAADSSVPAMTAGAAVSDTDLLYCAQSAGTLDRKCTPLQMAAYIFGKVSGDATASGTGALTFATVNANVGSFGSATSCVSVTANAKGLITAASAVTCTPGIASVTGLGTSVGTALGIAVGTAGSFVVNGGALGTPSSGIATNLTGTAAGLTAGNVTTNANLTGMVTSVGNAASLGSFTSANLLAALTDETGTGANVFGTAPTISSLNATTAATLAFITGSTQCLHVNSSGAISGTGSDCGAGGSGLTVGTTSIASGTTTRVLFDNAGVLGEYVISGTGNVAMTTSPVFTTPNLGTPSAVTLTSGTGLPISTGVSGLGTGIATWLATPSSANLAAALTDETGSGAAVFGTAPTISSLNATTAATLAFITGSTQCLQVNTSGVISGTGSACGGSGSTGANPTATASDTAVNGVATTFMRSDAAPAVQKATTSVFGLVKPDGVGIGVSGGVISNLGVTSVSAGCGTSTGGSPITTTGSVIAALTRRVNATTSDPIVAADCGNMVAENNAASIAVGIAAAGTTGFAAGFYTQVCNIGAGTATITPTTSTIGGAANYALPGGTAAAPVCVVVQSDGTNYNLAPDWTANASLLNAGTVAAARMPALTGDVTSSAGSTATTLSSGSASNLNAGTLAAARGGAGTITGALKGSGAGVVTQAACADLSNGATGCSTAVGTSGATIGLLNAANSWSGVQTFAASDLVLTGGSGCATFTAGVLSSTGSACGSGGGITFPQTVAGTTNSGGIPYFSAATTLSSSATLAANALVIGGGAGVAPSTTTTGTGILTALGVNVGSAGAPVTFNGAGGTPSSLTLTNATGLPLGGSTGWGTGVQTAAGNALSAAGGLTTTIASGSTALGTTAVASGACSSATTATATNTATTDTVLASFNGDPTAVTGFIPTTNGMLAIITYPTANTVNFKQCNNTSASITPGAITLNWRVVR